MSFEEFSSTFQKKMSFEKLIITPEWIKSYEQIYGQSIDEIDPDDLIFLREEYNNLNGNQPSLSLIKNNVTWDNFSWCDERNVYLFTHKNHGSFAWDDKSKMYICTSEKHNELEELEISI